MNPDQQGTRRVALVFGGSRGIGAGIVERLAKDGFDVALTFVSRPDAAQAALGAVEAAGGRGVAIQADSADPDAIRRAVAEAVGRLGPLDAVVVNAGVLRHGTIDVMSLEDLDVSLNVNVRGVYLAIQAALARMRDGGRVITIGSNTAIRTGAPGSSVYAMTKAAVAAMVQNLARDLAPRGITINNVQPGPIATDMSAPFAEYLRDKLPLGRMGQPADVGALVSYLAGAESGYMTGASLTIDGGWVL